MTNLPASVRTLIALLACVQVVACGGERQEQVLEFWGLGREGEVVEAMIPGFLAENPGLRVEVQQIPFISAHEKLLTAWVGESAPDLAQLGNTWVPEFHVLQALEPLDPWIRSSPVVGQENYFPGIWETNVVDGAVYGIPWYVDTRVLFYRRDLLAAAGHPAPPTSWDGWVAAMESLAETLDGEGYPILLPTDEWTQPVILALQTGSPFLDEEGRWGELTEPRFARAFDFYIELFRRGYAPVVSNAQIANVYQGFARGDFAMYVTGPWNIGEFRRRLPPEMEGKWGTAPLPAPAPRDPPGTSLAGGSSLVLFRSSPHKAAAWKLVEYLSRPEQQLRFYELSGDLPAVEAAWELPPLAEDPLARAFRVQLGEVAPTPRVAEWEQIATAIFEHAERAIRGRATTAEALRALDAQVDEILEKRRWVLARREEAAE